MKTLLRLLFVLVVLILLVVGAAFFVLTRPGVQKSLIEGQLPEGSSLRTVRVTTSSLELSELKLALPDGTKVRLGMLDADFKPLAALFDRTVEIGALNVDGLVVDLPKPIIQSEAGTTGPSVSDSVEAAGAAEPITSSKISAPAESAPGGSAMDAVYSIGQLDWLLDIDSIQLVGEVRDPSGSRYALSLDSGAIRPGEETTIEANLQLTSGDTLHAGLKELDANALLFLKQNVDGGFETVRLESQTTAADDAGNSLLAASQSIELSMDGFGETANIQLDFDVDLPRPEILVPEMQGVGALAIGGALSASAEGQALTVNAAEFSGSSAGAEVVAVDLKKQFTLGGKQDLSGDLMDLKLTSLPLAWLSPWLPEGIVLSGQDISAQLNLSGLPDGGMELRSLAPLQLGPLSLSQNGQPLLDQITIVAQPIIRIAADQSVSWDLGDFQVLDRYGQVISGQSTGRFDSASPMSGTLPSGLETQTKLSVGLQEVTQQPALAGVASIMSGRATLDLNVNPASEYPVQLQGALQGLSPRQFPGQRQDYRFAFQLNEPSANVLALGANVQAGASARPTTSLQLAGQVQPGSEPTAFKVDLNASRITQRDLEFLMAAFTSEGTPASAPTQVLSSGRATSQPAGPSIVRSSAPPPWAAFDGELNLSIQELVLISGDVIKGLTARATISEPLLQLSQLSGSLDGGELEGGGEVRYTDRQRIAYSIQTDLEFSDVDPAMFSKKTSGSFPVQGLFNGTAKFAGSGATLEDAIDDIEGDLIVTGREGVLKAFELDNRSQLGLLGAGILGQQLNRPGITALAQAAPYFTNMPFSDFTLKLTRGSDKRIVIPVLNFTGDYLLISGSGIIAATSLKDVMNQPLDLSLELGSKGKLIDYLETLQLLGPNTSEDGFRRWSQAIDIGGTLGSPDTTALKNLLNDAARRALSKPPAPPKEQVEGEQAPEGSQPAAQDSSSEGQGEEPERKKSKEERILEDIETGAQLINSLFGN